MAAAKKPADKACPLCGAPWHRYYRGKVLIHVACARGHTPLEALEAKAVKGGG